MSDRRAPAPRAAPALWFERVCTDGDRGRRRRPLRDRAARPDVGQRVGQHVGVGSGPGHLLAGTGADSGQRLRLRANHGPQLQRERGRAGATRGFLGQQAHAQRRDRVGDQPIRGRLAWIQRLTVNVQREDADEALGRERHVARQQLVEDHADAVDVGRRGQLSSHHPLGRQVIRRAEQRALLGLKPLAALGDLRDPKVEDLELGARRAAKHIGRLDVAVDDACSMRGGQPLAQLGEQLERVVEPAFVLEPGLEALAREQLHDHVRLLTGRPDVAGEVHDLDDLRGLDPAGRERLLLEARQVLGRLLRLTPQQLERDPAPQHGVLGLVDPAHAALAQQPHDPVALAHHRARLQRGIGVGSLFAAKPKRSSRSRRLGARFGWDRSTSVRRERLRRSRG
ncbi:hypothetical protein ENSA7_64040 [Enhygromyxa salina]|uniref:Uncharacterized protein n=1 Tax=Enhygromyxa salina TaxID=215803 RepID=A0A2S9Y2M4_9BACT|nr:hypothetical protein ENSA7_64040 [Enhygromyxa salina]